MTRPKTRHFMAGRMGAKIRSEKVDHTPLVTGPTAVIDTILAAVRSAGGCPCGDARANITVNIVYHKLLRETSYDERGLQKGRCRRLQGLLS